MAKPKKEKKAPATGETAKFNSAGKKRTTADLKAMGEKGAILRIVRQAVGLQNSKTDDKKVKKQLAGNMNSFAKKNGKLDNLDDSSEAYKGLKSAAKDFLISNNGIAAAKALTKYISEELGGGGGGRGRGFNPLAIADITL